MVSVSKISLSLILRRIYKMYFVEVCIILFWTNAAYLYFFLLIYNFLITKMINIYMACVRTQMIYPLWLTNLGWLFIKAKYRKRKCYHFLSYDSSIVQNKFFTKRNMQIHNQFLWYCIQLFCGLFVCSLWH